MYQLPGTNSYVRHTNFTYELQLVRTWYVWCTNSWHIRRTNLYIQHTHTYNFLPWMYDVQLVHVRTTLLTSTYNAPACTYNVQLIRMMYKLLPTHTYDIPTRTYDLLVVVWTSSTTYNLLVSLFNWDLNIRQLKHLSMSCQTLIFGCTAVAKQCTLTQTE